MISWKWNSSALPSENYYPNLLKIRTEYLEIAWARSVRELVISLPAQLYNDYLKFQPLVRLSWIN
jgi:hypothetical protein